MLRFPLQVAAIATAVWRFATAVWRFATAVWRFATAMGLRLRRRS